MCWCSESGASGGRHQWEGKPPPPHTEKCMRAHICYRQVPAIIVQIWVREEALFKNQEERDYRKTSWHFQGLTEFWGVICFKKSTKDKYMVLNIPPFLRLISSLPPLYSLNLPFLFIWYNLPSLKMSKQNMIPYAVVPAPSHTQTHTDSSVFAFMCICFDCILPITVQQVVLQFTPTQLVV